MSDTTTARLRATAVAVAPAVLFFGFVYHPYVTRGTDTEAIGAAAADTTRWGLSHLAIGVAYALLALAFLAIRSYLREAGEERWSRPALPLLVFRQRALRDFAGHGVRTARRRGDGRRPGGSPG